MTTTDERIVNIKYSLEIAYPEEKDMLWLLSELKALREFVAKQQCSNDIHRDMYASWDNNICPNCGQSFNNAGTLLTEFDRQREGK